MKIVAVIEARMGSTRLPGKVLKPILGKSVLELLIERIKRVKSIDEIIIATTTNKEDQLIKNLAEKLGVKCYRGKENDVLDRVLKAAKSIKGKIIVELLGDCPLIDNRIINRAIKLYFKGKYDYVANGCLKKTFPDGLGVQIYSTKLLEKVASLTNDPLDREHVTYYIYSHPERFKIKDFEAQGEMKWPKLAITLDTLSDYKLIKLIFEKLYPENINFSALDVVRFIKKNPKLVLISKNLQRRKERLANLPRGTGLKTKTNKYKAVIIGAGNIGAFYSRPANKKGILTHAHAYRKDERTELKAFVDINKKKVLKAATRWGVKAYTDANKMFLEEKPDIVSICTPDETHENILNLCLNYKPKIIFCEKPLTNNIKASKNLVRDFKKSGVILGVNYSRRWNDAFINLENEIKSRIFGDLLNGVGIYNKGILHNGSHLIDLLRWFFGDVKSGILFRQIIDWKKNDPSIDGLIGFRGDKKILILSGDKRFYSIFELDLFFQKARISIKESGSKVEYYTIMKSNLFPGDKRLKLDKVKKTKLKSTILRTVRNLIDSYEGKSNLLCSGTEALKTQVVCERLCKLKKTKGERIWLS